MVSVTRPAVGLMRNISVECCQAIEIYNKAMFIQNLLHRNGLPHMIQRSEAMPTASYIFFVDVSNETIPSVVRYCCGLSENRVGQSSFGFLFLQFNTSPCA